MMSSLSTTLRFFLEILKKLHSNNLCQTENREAMEVTKAINSFDTQIETNTKLAG